MFFPNLNVRRVLPAILMKRTCLKIYSLLFAIIGAFIILFCSEIWVKSNIYHPDAVTTVINDTTGKHTQAYLIGKMQVYIDKTYRMDMPLWTLFVNGEGMSNRPQTFKTIEAGDSALSLNKDNSDINENPFILRLKVKNLSYSPIDLNAQNFKIRTMNGTIVAPNKAWQDKLAEAGFYSGAGNKTQLGPNEERILWLVYGTKTEYIEPGTIQQEFVRMNYDSDSDILATKVEFPFNYTEDTVIGNYTSDYQYRYNIGFALALLWVAGCGAVYYRKSKNLDESDKDDED